VVEVFRTTPIKPLAMFFQDGSNDLKTNLSQRTVFIAAHAWPISPNGGSRSLTMLRNPFADAGGSVVESRQADAA
jgi:hypothetical protein